MKKLTKNQMAMLMGVIGVIIAALSYFLVYSPNIEKAETKEAENATLEIEVNRLMQLYAEMGNYRAATETLNKSNLEFESKFPSYIQPEDLVMLTKNMSDMTETEFTSLGFNSAMLVPYNGEEAVEPSLEGSTETAGEDEIVVNQTSLYRIPMSLSFSNKYDDFKGLIKYIYDQQNRLSVDGVSMSFDHTTGEITGSMSMYSYYLTGTGKPYSEPFVPNMGMGVESIFGETIQ